MVEIKTASLERLHDLQRIFSIDVVRATARRIESGYVVEALVSENEIEKLRRESYDVMILTDAEELGSQRRIGLG